MSGELVSDLDIETYEKDGVVCLRGVFGREWIDLLAAGTDNDIADPGPLHTIQQNADDPGFFLTDFCMTQRLHEFRRFALESPAGAIVHRLMRSRHVNFFYDGIWVKERGTPKRTRWHQDQPYYSVDGRHLCILWLPLDPVPREVCLELVRGSHLWGRWFQPELTRSGQDLYPGNTAFERMPDIEAERGRYDILTFDMKPGDVIAFQGMVVHGAPGNPGAGNRRRALSSLWLGEDAVFAARPGPVRPLFEGHGLQPGDAMDGPYFPRVWPRRADAYKDARFTDPAFRISI